PRRPRLERLRGLGAATRHGGATSMVGAMAALPWLGLPVVPEGQPFLLVTAILLAAILFGRASALVAALAATVLGTMLLLPSAGAAGVDAMRGGLSLVAFLIVAFGLAAAVEAMRRVFAVMEVADVRRATGAVVPMDAAKPGGMRLLLMSPQARRRRFER
ncbi:hypothetical protein, partial [Falsiroseomonas oryziterrae]|uniref:hypothetical protein n=1 Tax=Falsiroseomonas oryziterrae TaxID=2911368 RepID=UPI001F222862